jgi:transposase-like protein
MARERREVWEKRVERLRESGLTTREFAVEIGCNPDNLRHWKYKLEKDKGAQPAGADGATAAQRVNFVEVIGPMVSRPGETLVPIEVVIGRATIRVRHGFDAETLGRLLGVLEER